MDRFKFKKQVIAFILVIMQVCTPIMAIADSLIPENPVFDLKDIWLEDNLSRAIEFEADYDLLQEEKVPYNFEGSNGEQFYDTFWVLEDLKFKGDILGEPTIKISEENGFFIDEKEALLKLMNEKENRSGTVQFKLVLPESLKDIDWNNVQDFNIYIEPVFVKKEKHKAQGLFQEELKYFEDTLKVFSPYKNSRNSIVYLTEKPLSFEDAFQDFRGAGLYFYQINKDLHRDLEDYDYTEEKQLYGEEFVEKALEEGGVYQRFNRLTPGMVYHLGYDVNTSYMENTFPTKVLEIQELFQKMGDVQTEEQVKELKEQLSIEGVLKPFRLDILKQLGLEYQEADGIFWDIANEYDLKMRGKKSRWSVYEEIQSKENIAEKALTENVIVEEKQETPGGGGGSIIPDLPQVTPDVTPKINPEISPEDTPEVKPQDKIDYTPENAVPSEEKPNTTDEHNNQPVEELKEHEEKIVNPADKQDTAVEEKKAEEENPSIEVEKQEDNQKEHKVEEKAPTVPSVEEKREISFFGIKNKATVKVEYFTNLAETANVEGSTNSETNVDTSDAVPKTSLNGTDLINNDIGSIGTETGTIIPDKNNGSAENQENTVNDALDTSYQTQGNTNTTVTVNKNKVPLTTQKESGITDNTSAVVIPEATQNVTIATNKTTNGSGTQRVNRIRPRGLFRNIPQFTVDAELVSTEIQQGDKAAFEIGTDTGGGSKYPGKVNIDEDITIKFNFELKEAGLAEDKLFYFKFDKDAIGGVTLPDLEREYGDQPDQFVYKLMNVINPITNEKMPSGIVEVKFKAGAPVGKYFIKFEKLRLRVTNTNKGTDAEGDYFEIKSFPKGTLPNGKKSIVHYTGGNSGNPADSTNNDFSYLMEYEEEQITVPYLWITAQDNLADKDKKYIKNYGDKTYTLQGRTKALTFDGYVNKQGKTAQDVFIEVKMPEVEKEFKQTVKADWDVRIYEINVKGELQEVRKLNDDEFEVIAKENRPALIKLKDLVTNHIYKVKVRLSTSDNMQEVYKKRQVYFKINPTLVMYSGKAEDSAIVASTELPKGKRPDLPTANVHYKKPTFVAGFPMQVRDISDERIKNKYNHFRVSEMIFNDLSLVDPAFGHVGVTGTELEMSGLQSGLFKWTSQAVLLDSLKEFADQIGFYEWDDGVGNWKKIIAPATMQNFDPWANRDPMSNDSDADYALITNKYFNVDKASMLKDHMKNLPDKAYKIVYLQPLFKSVDPKSTANMYESIKESGMQDWTREVSNAQFVVSNLLNTAVAGHDLDLDFPDNYWNMEKNGGVIRHLGNSVQNYRIKTKLKQNTGVKITRGNKVDTATINGFRKMGGNITALNTKDELRNEILLAYNKLGYGNIGVGTLDIGTTDFIHDPNHVTVGYKPFNTEAKKPNVVVKSVYEPMPGDHVISWNLNPSSAKLEDVRNTLNRWKIHVDGVTPDATNLSLKVWIGDGSLIRSFYKLNNAPGDRISTATARQYNQKLVDQLSSGSFDYYGYNGKTYTNDTEVIEAKAVSQPDFVILPMRIWEKSKDGATTIRELMQGEDYTVRVTTNYSQYDRGETLKKRKQESLTAPVYLNEKEAAERFLRSWYEMPSEMNINLWSLKGEHKGENGLENGRKTKMEIVFSPAVLTAKQLDSKFEVEYITEKTAYVEEGIVGSDAGDLTGTKIFDPDFGHNWEYVTRDDYFHISYLDGASVQFKKTDKNPDTGLMEESTRFDSHLYKYSLETGGEFHALLDDYVQVNPDPPSGGGSVTQHYATSSDIKMDITPIYFDKNMNEITWRLWIKDFHRWFGPEDVVIKVNAEDGIQKLVKGPTGKIIQSPKWINYDKGKDNLLEITGTSFEYIGGGDIDNTKTITNDGTTGAVAFKLEFDQPMAGGYDFTGNENDNSKFKNDFLFEFKTRYNDAELIQKANNVNGVGEFPFKINVNLKGTNVTGEFEIGDPFQLNNRQTNSFKLDKSATFTVPINNVLDKKGLSTTTINSVDAPEVIDWKIDFNRLALDLHGNEVTDVPTVGQKIIPDSLKVYEELVRLPITSTGHNGAGLTQTAEYPNIQVFYKDVPLNKTEVAERFDVVLLPDKLAFTPKAQAGTKSYSFKFKTEAPPPRYSKYSNIARIGNLYARGEVARGFDPVIFKYQGSQVHNSPRVKWKAIINNGAQTMNKLVLKDYLSINQDYDLTTLKLSLVDTTGGTEQANYTEIPKTDYTITRITHGTGENGITIAFKDSFTTNKPIEIRYETQIVNPAGQKDFRNKLDIEYNTGHFGSSGWVGLEKEYEYTKQSTGVPLPDAVANTVYLRKIDENNAPIVGVKFRHFKVLEENQEGLITKVRFIEEKETGVNGLVFFNTNLDADPASALKFTNVIVEVQPQDYIFYPYTAADLYLNGLEPAKFLGDVMETGKELQNASWGFKPVVMPGGEFWTKAVTIKNKHVPGTDGEKDIPVEPVDPPEAGNGTLTVKKVNKQGQPLENILFQLYEIHGNVTNEWVYVGSKTSSPTGEAIFTGLKKNMRYVVFEPQLGDMKRWNPMSGKLYVDGQTTADWTKTVTFVNEKLSALVGGENPTVKIKKVKAETGVGIPNVYFRLYEVKNYTAYNDDSGSIEDGEIHRVEQPQNIKSMKAIGWIKTEANGELQIDGLLDYNKAYVIMEELPDNMDYAYQFTNDKGGANNMYFFKPDISEFNAGTGANWKRDLTILNKDRTPKDKWKTSTVPPVGDDPTDGKEVPDIPSPDVTTPSGSGDPLGPTGETDNLLKIQKRTTENQPMPGVTFTVYKVTGSKTAWDKGGSEDKEITTIDGKKVFTKPGKPDGTDLDAWINQWKDQVQDIKWQLIGEKTTDNDGNILLENMQKNARYVLIEHKSKCYDPVSHPNAMIWIDGSKLTKFVPESHVIGGKPAKNYQVYPIYITNEPTGLCQVNAGEFEVTLHKKSVNYAGTVENNVSDVKFRIFRGIEGSKQQLFVKEVTTELSGKVTFNLPKFNLPTESNHYYSIEEVLPDNLEFNVLGDGTYNGIIKVTAATYAANTNLSYILSNDRNTRPVPPNVPNYNKDGEPDEPLKLPVQPSAATNTLKITKYDSEGNKVTNVPIQFELYAIDGNNSNRVLIEKKALQATGELKFTGLDKSRRYFVREVPDATKFKYLFPASGSAYVVYSDTETNVEKELKFYNIMNSGVGTGLEAEYVVFKRDQYGKAPTVPIEFKIYKVIDSNAANKKDPANLTLLQTKQTDISGKVHFKGLTVNSEYYVKETPTAGYTAKEPLNGEIFVRTGAALATDEPSINDPLAIHPHAGKWVGGDIFINTNADIPVPNPDPINPNPEDTTQPKDGTIEVLKKDTKGRLMPSVEFKVYEEYIDQGFVPKWRVKEVKTTDIHGLATFTGLQRGRKYQTRETVPAGWVVRSPFNGISYNTISHKNKLPYYKHYFINEKGTTGGVTPKISDVTVAIKKVGEGNKPLHYVGFQLQVKNAVGKYVDKYFVSRTDKQGILIFRNLERNKEYRLKEILPAGYTYKSHGENIDFTANDDPDQVFVFIVENQPIAGGGKNVPLIIYKRFKQKGVDHSVPQGGVKFRIYRGKDAPSKPGEPSTQVFVKEVVTGSNGEVRDTVFIPDKLESGEYLIVEEVLPDNYEYNDEYHGVAKIPINRDFTDKSKIEISVLNRKNEQDIPPGVPGYSKKGEDPVPPQPPSDNPADPPGTLSTPEDANNILKVRKYDQNGNLVTGLSIDYELYEVDNDSLDREFISSKNILGTGEVVFDGLDVNRRYFVREKAGIGFEYLFPASGTAWVTFVKGGQTEQTVNFYNKLYENGNGPVKNNITIDLWKRNQRGEHLKNVKFTVYELGSDYSFPVTDFSGLTKVAEGTTNDDGLYSVNRSLKENHNYLIVEELAANLTPLNPDRNQFVFRTGVAYPHNMDHPVFGPNDAHPHSGLYPGAKLIINHDNTPDNRPGDPINPDPNDPNQPKDGVVEILKIDSMNRAVYYKNFVLYEEIQYGTKKNYVKVDAEETDIDGKVVYTGLQRGKTYKVVEEKGVPLYPYSGEVIFTLNHLEKKPYRAFTFVNEARNEIGGNRPQEVSDIKIYKTDEYRYPLSNVNFELYEGKGAGKQLLKATNKTDSSGFLDFHSLNVNQQYTIIENPLPTGFNHKTYTNGVIEVEAPSAGQIKTIEVENKTVNTVKKAKIRLSKKIRENGVDTPMNNVTFKVYRHDTPDNIQKFIRTVKTGVSGEVAFELPIPLRAVANDTFIIEEILPDDKQFTWDNEVNGVKQAYNNIIKLRVGDVVDGQEHMYEMVNIKNTHQNTTQDPPGYNKKGEDPAPPVEPNKKPGRAANKLIINKYDETGTPLLDLSVTFELYEVNGNLNDRVLVGTKSTGTTGTTTFSNLKKNQRYFVREVPNDKMEYFYPVSGTAYVTTGDTSSATSVLNFYNKKRTVQLKPAELNVFKVDQQSREIDQVEFKVYRVKNEAHQPITDSTNLELVTTVTTGVNGFAKATGLKERTIYYVKETPKAGLTPFNAADSSKLIRTGEALPDDHPSIHKGKWVGTTVFVNISDAQTQPEPVNPNPEDPNQPKDGHLIIVKEDEQHRVMGGVNFDVYEYEYDVDHVLQRKHVETVTTSPIGLAKVAQLQRGKSYVIYERSPAGYAPKMPNNYGMYKLQIGVDEQDYHEDIIFVNEKLAPGGQPKVNESDATVALVKKDNQGNRLKDITFKLYEGKGNTKVYVDERKTNKYGVIQLSNLKRDTDYTLEEVLPAGHTHVSHPNGLIEVRTGDTEESLVKVAVVNKVNTLPFTPSGNKLKIDLTKNLEEVGVVNGLPNVKFKIYFGTEQRQQFMGDITTNSLGKAEIILDIPIKTEIEANTNWHYFIEEVLPDNRIFDIHANNDDYNGILRIPLILYKDNTLAEVNLSKTFNNKTNNHNFPKVPDFNKDGEKPEPAPIPRNPAEPETRTNSIKVEKYDSNGLKVKRKAVTFALYELEENNSNRVLKEQKATIDGEAVFSNLSDTRRYFIRELPNVNEYEYLLPASGTVYLTFEAKDQQKIVKFYNHYPNGSGETPQSPPNKPNNPPVDPPKKPEKPPVNPDNPPKDPEDKPKDPEDKPKDPEDKPKDPEDKPKDPEDKPKDPEDKPKDPEDKPKDPEDKPKDPENPNNPGIGDGDDPITPPDNPGGGGGDPITPPDNPGKDEDNEDTPNVTPDRPNVTPDRPNVTPDRPNNDLPWKPIIPIIPNPDDKQAPIDNDIPRDKGEETPDGLPVGQEQPNDTVIPTDNITKTPGNNTELDQGAPEIKNKKLPKTGMADKKALFYLIGMFMTAIGVYLRRKRER